MRNPLADGKVDLPMKRLVLIATMTALSGCLPHPPPAPAPYRAVGQAVDWTLVIDDRFLTFFPAPGQQPILQPSVKPIIGIAGEIYQTPRIGVNIVHAQCSDGRTDRVYPDRVQVDVDGRRYNGCGGL
jgi:heat shock protein HslJ